MGYDSPVPMGKGNTGGKLAAPVFGSFMKDVLADQPASPFRIPPGIKLARVNLRTGLRAGEEDPPSIVEAFKPGEEPDDAYSEIGFTDQGGGAPGGDDESSAEDAYQPAPRQMPATPRGAAVFGEPVFRGRCIGCGAPSRLQPGARRLYQPSYPEIALASEATMRAEPQKLVDSIKEALGLLRRHL